jgi:hypothetical protein
MAKLPCHPLRLAHSLDLRRRQCLPGPLHSFFADLPTFQRLRLSRATPASAPTQATSTFFSSRVLDPVVVVIALLVTHPVQSPAESLIQDRTDGVERCGQCRITLTHESLIGDSLPGGDGAMMRVIRGVHRGADGSYFVSFFDTGELVARFDHTGSFRGRVGRFGAAPGELRNPFVVATRGDSLYLLDQATGLLTTLNLRLPGGSSQSGPLREATFGPLDAVRLRDGRYVMNIVLFRSQDLGYPLHLFSPSGTKLLSFGIDVPHYRPDRPALAYRRLTPDRDGGVWAVHQDAPILEHFDRDGRLIKRLQLNMRWLPVGTGERLLPHPAGSPPTPSVRAIWLDSMNVLWISTWVADSRWKQAFGSPSRTQAPTLDGSFYPITDRNRLYDTILAAIEVSTGSVLAMLRVDAALLAVMDGSFAASPRPLPNGASQIDIWRMQLKR